VKLRIIGKKDSLNKYCGVGILPAQITTSDVENHINHDYDENEYL
jgi:hypothetical protein